MKIDELPVNDEKKINGNGTDIIAKKNGMMKISADSNNATNGDIHSDDSRSNGETMAGAGDLLVEDTSATRNGIDDNIFQNRSKADDTTSLSSNSSNFAAVDIEDDLSDEMTLRLSDEEDICEVPKSGGLKRVKIPEKDNPKFTTYTSSPLPPADNCKLSENNHLDEPVGTSNELLAENKLLEDSPQKLESNLVETIDKVNAKDTCESTSDSNKQLEPTDKLDKSSNNENCTENTSETKADDNSDENLESFISEMIRSDAESSINKSSESNTNDNITISDLRKEIEEYFDKDDSSSSDKVDSEIDNDSLKVENDEKACVEKHSTENTSDNLISSEIENDSEKNIQVHSENENSLENSSVDSKIDSNKDSIQNSNDKQISSENEKCSEKSSNDTLVSSENDVASKESISENNTSPLSENNSENVIASENEHDIKQNDIEIVESQIKKEVVETDPTINEKKDVTDTNMNLENTNPVTESTSCSDSPTETLKATEDAPMIIDSDTNIDSDDKSDQNAGLLVATEQVADESEEPTSTAVSSNSTDSEPMDVDPTEDDSTVNLPESTEKSTTAPESKDDATTTIDNTPESVDDKDTSTVKEQDLNNEAITEPQIDESNDVKKEVEEIKSVDIKFDNKDSCTKFDDVKVQDNLKGSEAEVKAASTLKRSLEKDEVTELDSKKPKINGSMDKKEVDVKKEYVTLAMFKDFMAKKSIDKMTRAELEEFCLQKMCEAIDQSSKVGELIRVVKRQDQMIEAMRTRSNFLVKQVRDLEVVHTRIIQEVRAKIKEGGNVSDATPVKITRSVGLQVNLLQAPTRVRASLPLPPEQPSQNPPGPKRKMQRTSLPNKLPSAAPIQITPPAKPSSPLKPTASPTVQSKNIKTILPKVLSGSEVKESQSNGSLLGSYLQKGGTSNAQGTTVTKKPSTDTAKVIDLTDEDDNKSSTSTTAVPPAPVNIRVVGSHQLGASNSTVAPIVAAGMPRLTYLLPQQGQPVLLATSTGPTRPGQVRPTLMFKPVAPGQVPTGQRLNLVRPGNVPGTVTVLPNSTPTIRAGQQIRITSTNVSTTVTRPVRVNSTYRHPAPLPGPPAVQPSQPSWKAMPPKPSLKISRVGDGIVLSWKMLNKDMSLYEEIASYQLYAYQETNAAPSTDMWRKVGDVKALALPMACTLTQFTDGNKYHFAVRAVDVKSRVGPFSPPEQISLP